MILSIRIILCIWNELNLVMTVYGFHILMDSVNYHWAWRFCLLWLWMRLVLWFSFLTLYGFLQYQDSAISWNELVSTIPSRPSLWGEYDFLLQRLAAFSGTDIRDLELLVLGCCVCGGSGLVAESCPTLATKDKGAWQAGYSPWDSPGKNLAWAPFPSPGTFPPRNWNPILLCRLIPYQLSYKGSPCVCVCGVTYL